MVDYDLIIVGGGISGLSGAWRAVRAGARVLLLEGSDRLGGCVHTQRSGEGFWYELGAHTCFNSYGALIGLLEETGLAGDLVLRRRLPYRLWDGTRRRRVAASLGWGELLRHLPRVLATPRADLSVGDYFRRITGPRNAERVFVPALSAMLCQPAGPFPAAAVFHRRPRRKQFPRSFTLPGGLGSLVEALARAPGLTALTGRTVESLVRVEDAWEAAAGDGRWRAPRVLLALPPGPCARLLAAVPGAPVEALGGIGEAPLESLGVCLRVDTPGLPPLAGLIGAGAPFYSAVSRDVVADPNRRAFTFHFPRGGVERDAVARALGAGPEAWLETAPATATLPALRPGHGGRVAAIDAALAQLPGLGLAGNWFAGVALEDCVLRAGSEVRRLLGDI